MIPQFRPTIRRVDMDAVLRRLANDSIGTGQLASELSHAVGRFLGKRGGISVRSQPIALRAVLTAAGLEEGARVGVSVLAPAFAHRSISQAGFEPVVLDVAPDLPVLDSPLNTDYDDRELDAIIVDTRLGCIPDLESFSQMGVPLFEIVSEGYGGYLKERMVGSFGFAAIVGLEPDHILTAGGGAVCVVGGKKTQEQLASVPCVRDNSLPDMNAALGLAQVAEADRFIERRHETYARFHRILLSTKNKAIVQHLEGEAVFSCFPVRVSASPLDVEKYARKHGVSTKRMLSGSVLELLRGRAESEDDLEQISVQYENGVAFAGNTLLFPLYPAMRTDETKTVERVLGTLP